MIASNSKRFLLQYCQSTKNNVYYQAKILQQEQGTIKKGAVFAVGPCWPAYAWVVQGYVGKMRDDSARR